MKKLKNSRSRGVTGRHHMTVRALIQSFKNLRLQNHIQCRDVDGDVFHVARRQGHVYLRTCQQQEYVKDWELVQVGDRCTFVCRCANLSSWSMEISLKHMKRLHDFFHCTTSRPSPAICVR